MSQSLRNKIYGAITGVLSVLVVLGVVDQVTSEQAVTLAAALLDQVEAILGLVASITAFVKSLPSRTTTLDIPRNDVEAVYTTGQQTIAGPASSAPDGTVIR